MKFNFTAFLVATFCVALITGCSSTGGGPLPNFETVVLKRASYDFNCSESSIKTIQYKLLEYGAKGCGKERNYKVRCDNLGPCVADPM